MTAFNPNDALERQKRIAWEVASNTAVTTKEDPVLLYKKLMDRYVIKQTEFLLSQDKNK